MGNIIIAMLEAIFAGSFVSGAESLREAVASYNTGAYAFAHTVNSVAVKPVAAVILAIILVLELARITTRYGGDQKTGAQVVAVAMLKAALLVVAIQNVELILQAMNGAGEAIIGKTTELTPAATNQQLPTEIREAVDNTSTLDKAGLMLVLFIPWVLSTIGSMAVKIMVFIRFAEIYILSAAATLPLAFLGHDETKSIAVGFLKRYGGAVLHGVMIIIIVAVYAKLNLGGINLAELNSDSLLSELTKEFGTLVAQPVVFMYLMFGSSKLARSMLGDG